MENAKGLLQSKTFWASVVSMGMFALNASGKDTSGIDPNAVSGYVVDAVGAASGLVAIWGRISATAPIKGVLPK